MRLLALIGSLLPFAVVFLCFFGQAHRIAAMFMRHVMRRKSICVPIRQSLLSPVCGSDWRVEAGIRIDAANDRTNARAWGYTFSTEAHLFHEGQEIKLAGWEQYVLNRALRARGRIVNREQAGALHAANQNRLLQLAEQFCDSYGRNVQ